MNSDQRGENIPLMKMEKNVVKFEYQRTISSIKDPQVRCSQYKKYRRNSHRMFWSPQISIDKCIPT